MKERPSLDSIKALKNASINKASEKEKKIILSVCQITVTSNVYSFSSSNKFLTFQFRYFLFLSLLDY